MPACALGHMNQNLEALRLGTRFDLGREPATPGPLPVRKPPLF